MARRFVLHGPLMWLDKAATWRLAHDLGGGPLVGLVREETLTVISAGAGHHMTGAMAAAHARR